MKLLCYLCALSLAFGTIGCKSKSKTTPAIAGEVEESFKQRWIAKRMNELLSSGKITEAREARLIAADEFKKQYAFTSAAAKGDPVSSNGSQP